MSAPAPEGQEPAFEERLAKLLRDFLGEIPSPARLGWDAFVRSLAARPERLAEIQQRYYRDQLALWTQALSPGGLPPAQEDDRRFAAAAWSTLPYFQLLKQSYLLHARWLNELVEAADLPADTRQRLRFALHQYLDAAAPTNYPATNPEAISLAAQTGGGSLLAGLRNVERDVARGRIRMTDEGAFTVGRNLAVTPGAVIYENAVAQLIQYAPRTSAVHARPLLIVPPFINRYYILDLQPHNSFVRYALDCGMQVFMVSWRSACTETARCTWDDYVEQGVLAPLAVALEVTGSKSANALGFCVGGTLLATAAAVMPKPARLASLTLLATMLDFSDVGDIGVYIDADYVREREREYEQGGLVPGHRLAAAFASLRANDLIWHFVVNNYLLGREPKAFDLLHWNADSASLPGPLYAWYLRQMYLENKLRTPGGVEVLGQAVDLSRITAPAYLLATREDHIVPWRSAFAATKLLGGKMTFTLGASGHIAGVVNPPQPERRCYWSAPLDGSDADGWLAQARRRPGSWWPHWSQWLRRRGGRLVGAPASLGSDRYTVIEPAPGRYVREPAV